MKNLFSILFVSFAALMISCGGNTNATATTEEAVEEIAVVEDACCEAEGECDGSEEGCCKEAAEEVTE